MANRELVERIDESLVRRISELSPGAQRWLKTAVQTIRTTPTADDSLDLDTPPKHLRITPMPTPKSTPTKRKRAQQPIQDLETPGPPSLEDVITRGRKLDEAEQYPHIAGELEGLGDIIDLLRGLGESRRKRGEEILREDILNGGADSAETDVEPDDDDFSF